MTKPLVKVTLNIAAGDREILQRFFPKLGWSTAARNVLHNFCKKLEEQANTEINREPISVDIPIES